MASPLQSLQIALNSPAGLSFSVGFFLAIIGATSGIGPIAILLISLIYFWKERSRARLLISIPVFQYLIVQFLLTWWHSGDLFAIEMQQYYLVLLFAVPVIHFFVTDFEFDVPSLIQGIIVGLALSTVLLAIDFFSVWNNNSCRALAFQTNPLRTTLHMVPLASLVIALQAQKGKFGWMSAALVVLVLVTTGNLTGSRMTFYSVFVVLALILFYFLAFKNILAAKRLVFTVIIGFIFVVAFDSAAGCNFFQRLTNNFTNVLSVVTGKTPDPIAVVQSNEVQQEQPSLSDQSEASGQNQAKDQDQTQNPNKAKDKAKPQGQSKKKVTKPKRNRENATSEGIRLLLWQNAVASIRAHPFLGEGAQRENEIAQLSEGRSPRGGMSHNQYLSWAIWGGVVSLISAFIFMATHLLTTQNRFAATLFIIPWLTSSLTISTFYQVGTMAEFVVTLIVLMPLLGIKKTRWIFSRPR